MLEMAKLHSLAGTYLDREFVLLHSRVDKEEQRLRQQSFVLRVAQQLQIVAVDGQSRLVDLRTSLVKADQAFLRVDFAVKFEHTLSEL